MEASAPDTTLDNDDPNVTYDGTGLVIDEANDIITHSNELSDMWGGIGIEVGDVWLKYELDQIYKLFELEIWNFNAVEPSNEFGGYEVEVSYSTDNETWETLEEVQLLNKGTGLNTYSDYDIIDMNGAIAKYVKLTFLSSYNSPGFSAGGISEIRFLVIPTRASEPSPEDKNFGVPLDAIFKWKTGRGTDIHRIYIGSDKTSVKEGNADIIEDIENATYEITFDIDSTYYWRVDEVNDAEEYAVWDGPVWKFSTVQFIVVDDFESDKYDDSDTNSVYAIWQDHYTTGESDNTSNMGREYGPPYLQTISRSGNYSAPMSYYNSYGGYAQVIADTEDLAIGSDWSKGNPNVMEIWFMSDANEVNEPVLDQLYCIINDGDKVIYDGDAANIRRTIWSKFEVPLDGIDLNDVTSVVIGLEPIDGTTGSNGTIYLDDIRLAVSYDAVNPGTENLIALYEMEDNVMDSSGNGYDGEPNNGILGNGGLTYEAGKYGNALVFDGNDDYVLLPIGDAISTLTNCTISTWVKWDGGDAWQRVFDFGNDTTKYMHVTPNNNSDSVLFAITTNSTAGENTAGSSSDMGIGFWEHIAVVIDADNGTITLYRNGEKESVNYEADTYPKDLGSTTKNYLGKSQWDDPAFKGMIDDFRIYDRALSAGEVKYLFKN